MFYSLFIISEKNESTPLCTKCLRIAARFSSPLLQRVEAEQGTETAFVCHSSGGFPEPAVYWLIDDTEEPPEGSVRTLAVSHPDSHLYNITSHLTASISKDSSVSCIIDNKFMNETLTSMSYGLRSSKVVSRASEAMWIFSTVLCVLVGVLVIVGVVYQIHQDRMSKRKKYQDPDRGYRRRRLHVEETDMKTEPPESDL
uniref:ICOS ligand-like isoform X2 n=1 Tax=Monopterus albus TaxID=43700 RepID=UPI0009B48D61|nr:ICOS ligand-like isoform X2 [Monopterus albus]